MPKLKLTVQKFIIAVTTVTLVAAYPLAAYADDPAPCPQASGTTAPTGADGLSYTFNPNTCLWENAYYTWDPITKVTTPTYTQTYAYNNATGQYDTTVYIWNAAAGAYQPVTLSYTQPPAGAVVVGGPTPATTDPAITPDSTASADNPTADPSTTSTNNMATVDNTLNSTANSGDALVFYNTTAGSATSGNTLDSANILNLLQSNSSLQDGLATFTVDIAGDVNHDIVLDPSQLTSSDSTISANTSPTNLTINTQDNGQINNDINLAAGSGNATVAYNTTAGDATTGSADTMANIMNVINSIISSGQSFVGTINIDGNLNGDILMPQDVLSNLLASNSAPTVTTDISNDSQLAADLTNNTDINNNVDLSAKTGDATISHNTTAGDATTGDATTNLTLLNLTGRQVIGDDALLVFVNVLGKWVGMIVNAPTGSTAAALGGGITTNSAQTGCNGATNTNSSINNNVNLNSTSGNALVNNNTTAGDATSGNATASANILNVACSNLQLNKWLGVLFINVFGSWNGSFGINTAAGDNPTDKSTDTTNPSLTLAKAVKSVKVFSLAASGNGGDFSAEPVATANSPAANNHQTVLSAVTTDPPSPSSHRSSLLWTAGSLFALAGVLSAEEAVARRKEARAKLRGYLRSITVEPLKRY